MPARDGERVTSDIQDTFARLLQAAPDGVLVVNDAGRVVFANAEAERLFGYPSAELEGLEVDVLVPQRLADVHRRHRAGYLRDPRTRPMGAGLDLAGRRRDGTEFPVDISLSSMRSPEGRLVTAFVRDVTDRRRARDELRASEERFRLLAENATDVIYRFRVWPEAGFEYLSPAVTDLTGYTPQEFYDDPQLMLLLAHPDELEALVQAGEDGRMAPRVMRWLRKDGRVIWVEHRSSFVRDGSGRLLATQGIARDVTERVEAEERTRRSEALLAEAQAIGKVGSWEWDIRMDTLTWSDELYRLFGVTREDFPATYDAFLDRVHPADRERVDAEIRRVFETEESFAFDHRVVRPDGTEAVLHARGRVVTDEAGGPVRMAGTAQDITGRHLVEQRLRDLNQAQRHFIADAAHELRTPLTALVGIAGTFAASWRSLDEADIAEAVAAMVRQGERATVLVNNLLDLSAAESGQLFMRSEPVAVKDAVAAALNATPPPGPVTVDVRIPRGLVVHTDPDRLEQVFTNLLTNAYRYGGPRVMVEADRAHGAVRIRVRDDGPGVPADLVPRVFEPFTRAAEARPVPGSGLGLSIVLRLMEAAGGSVRYERVQPSGACFVLTLPEQAAKSSEGVLAGNERV